MIVRCPNCSKFFKVYHDPSAEYPPAIACLNCRQSLPSYPAALQPKPPLPGKLRVQCNDCRKIHEIDYHKISPGTVQARCRGCGQLMSLPPHTGQVPAAPLIASQAPALAPTGDTRARLLAPLERMKRYWPAVFHRKKWLPVAIGLAALVLVLIFLFSTRPTAGRPEFKKVPVSTAQTGVRPAPDMDVKPYHQAVFIRK